MDKICGIYMIENKSNMKKYIGQTIDIYKRWNSHKNELRSGTHNNRHLQHSWDKYGEQCFIFSIVEECSEDELDDREIYWIQKYNSFYSGYNQTQGGGGMRGFKYSDESRKKMSQSAKHKPPVSEETRQKHRERMSGENNPFYGVKFLGEQNPFFGDHRFAGENHPRCRAIYCIELDEIFWGAKEAQDKYGVYKADIAKCCNGKAKSAGKHPITGEKLHWIYVENMNNSSIT